MHKVRRWWYRWFHRPEGIAVVKDGKFEIGIIPNSDQVVVLEDKFKSGYECTTCEGESYLEEDCDFCKGTGKENIGTPNEVMCRMCCPPQLVQTMGTRPGKKLCPNCSGKGSLLIAPEISQRRPTSGIIKAIGPDVMMYDVGQRALYSMFAGTSINFKQKGVIRIMHSHEIMGELVGTGKLGDWQR